MGFANPYWCVYPVCWIVYFEFGHLMSDFGFPIVIAVGMGYFVFFVYQSTPINIGNADAWRN